MTTKSFFAHAPRQDFKDFMFDCSVPCGWVSTILLLNARVVGKYSPTLNNLNKKIMTIISFVAHAPKVDFKDVMFDCSIPCG